ncbi:MAG TPA: hypothetical protein VMC05_12045 [Xanthobacteraceae bacterium]|nr:hypothetical protein [Xanthobacteraceae bacterium]
MIRFTLAAAAGTVWLVAMTMPPAAAETAPDTAGGRYMFEKQAGPQGAGYIRLDTQTGEVALCSQRTIGWACETAPDDRTVLENEIARLRAENGALKKELLARGLPLPPGANPEQPAQSNQIVVPLPSNADLDRMVAMVGQAWHRFVEAIQQAQKQVFNKS